MSPQAAQWVTAMGGGGSEGMSEICSNCEIFNTGMSMELISANLTLFFNIFKLCGGQTVPSQWGGARLFATSEDHLHKNGSKSSTWTSRSPFHLCSTLFQPFGTTGAFRSPFWPTWALFGLFLGPRGPKFDKFCVGEVERGPGHLES